MLPCGGAHGEQALYPALSWVRTARRPFGLGRQRWAASSQLLKDEERCSDAPFPAVTLVISMFLQHHW